MVLSGEDEALQAGAADIAIGSQAAPGFLGDPLLRVKFIAVAHPLHALGRPLNMAGLRREAPVVARDAGWLGAEQRWTVSSLEAALSAVCHGLGFAWLLDHLIAPALADGRLKPLPLREGQHDYAALYLIVASPDRRPGNCCASCAKRRPLGPRPADVSLLSLSASAILAAT